jgi:hypothetical protein
MRQAAQASSQWSLEGGQWETELSISRILKVFLSAAECLLLYNPIRFFSGPPSLLSIYVSISPRCNYACSSISLRSVPFRLFPQVFFMTQVYTWRTAWCSALCTVQYGSLLVSTSGTHVATHRTFPSRLIIKAGLAPVHVQLAASPCEAVSASCSRRSAKGVAGSVDPGHRNWIVDLKIICSSACHFMEVTDDTSSE